jgi:hypothetical protein|tara:strand:- start:775 stop:978 length:204 start_codon:yes stop_codon:yes gene_type:complete
MNKITLQKIANKLESTVKLSNPNIKYNELMGLVKDLNNAINQPEEGVEEKTTKKKKSTKKKKTSTED